jgi:hypothetical protein
MEYNFQGHDQAEDGDVVFLLNEIDPRALRIANG